MKLTFRGSMPAPKHEHGEILARGGIEGVVQHRRWNRKYWEYGLIVSNSILIMWVQE